MTRVLITGASGFVGHALVASLSASGYAVRAAVRRPSQPAFAPDIELIAHPDMTTPFEWSPLLAGVDGVVHLAGIAHTAAISESDYDRINHRATAELAVAARHAGVKRLVFISSIRAQSGPTSETILTEDDEPRPTDAYGRSKLAAELAVKSAGVPYTILRPVLVYGPGVKGNLALLRRIAELPFPLPFGMLRNPRSVVAREDLISAIRLSLKTPTTGDEIFIVAHPVPSSTAEMISALRTARGRKPGLFSVPPSAFSAGFALLRRRDLWERLAGRLVASSDRLRSAGWSPMIDAKSGFAALGRAGLGRGEA